MRILVVGINYAPDLIGVAKYNTELCEALVLQGHEVRMVTAPPYYPAWAIPPACRGWQYRRATINGVAVTRAPIYVPRIPTGAKRLIHHASFALSSAWPVISEAYRWRPDLVFTVAPSLMSATLASFVARRTGASSWLHIQDFEIDAAFDLGLLSNTRLRPAMVAIERRILRSFDRVSTISPQMLTRLEYKGVDAGKIREIRNWTDTGQITPRDRNTPFRRSLRISPTQLVGLYSGTMSNKQGLDLIIEAARELSKDSPLLQFVLCGDGPHKSKLQAMATGLTNVHFLGLQAGDQFTELLNTADFHLIPQRAEAADLVLPSKLGGILASGQPVIAMANPGTGLANEVEGAGLVVSPGSARALADAARSLVSDHNLRQSLGQVGRLRALERWDKAKIVMALEREFLELSNSGICSQPLLTKTGTDVGRKLERRVKHHV